MLSYLLLLGCSVWCLLHVVAGPVPAPALAPAGVSVPPVVSQPGAPLSPCPGVFRYERRGAGWAGSVQIPAPPPGQPLVVRVQLSVRAALPTKYAGSLQLVEGRGALLTRLAAGDRRPVRYKLLFPPGTPLPIVTRVQVAGTELCRGLPESGSVTTTISLEHSVRPEPLDAMMNTRQQPAENESGGGDEEEECGRPVPHAPLVAAGAATSPGDWPWLAAVFASTALGLEFHCAGSLVSASFVVTAAHCVHQRSADTLLVYLGRHNVRKWTEQQAQAREVAYVHVHPEYQPANYTSDLAVLELAERAAFDWYVRPVCIDWEEPGELAAVVGRIGTVVGWGRDERGRRLTPEPRAARLPIVSQEACLRSRPDFVHVTSDRTLCAGFRNGSGPCNGDSGSGLVLPAEDGSWTLRGVVSLSLFDGDRHTCDLRQYVVFTDVVKFRDWLGSLVRPKNRRPQTTVKQQQLDPQDEQPIWDSDPLPD